MVNSMALILSAGREGTRQLSTLSANATILSLYFLDVMTSSNIFSPYTPKERRVAIRMRLSMVGSWRRSPSCWTVLGFVIDGPSLLSTDSATSLYLGLPWEKRSSTRRGTSSCETMQSVRLRQSRMFGERLGMSLLARSNR